jgi:predicted nuclease of predicted toxin-antitoxin system
VILRWLADENFNNDIVRALWRKDPRIDIIRTQDAGLIGIDDDALLAWAAEQERVLLTHDVSTMTACAWRPGDEG